MKKSKLIILPIVLCLTGCFKFEITKNPHDGGLFGQSGEQILGDFSYEEYNGGSFEKGSYSNSVITSKIDTSTMEFKTPEDIKDYFYDNDSIINSIENFSYVARNNKGFRIGDAKKELRGAITFNLSRPVAAVEIEAYPFVIEHDDLNESETVVDQDVQLSVNDLGFIKVNSAFENEIVPTVCSYKLSSSSDNIKIVCGPNRAVISKITFYY